MARVWTWPADLDADLAGGPQDTRHAPGAADGSHGSGPRAAPVPPDQLDRPEPRRRESELRQAAVELEQRVEQRTAEALRAAGAVKEAEERLHFLLDAASIGYWDFDTKADAV